jgi:chromate transport protein ChrA
MKTWKIIIVGIVFAIIAQVIHTAESMATMSFYTDPTYFGVWSKIMMPGEGPPPTEFYYYSIVFAVITGIIYAVIFEMIKKSIPRKTAINQGLYFGFLLFLLGIPWTLTMYLLINLPSVLLFYWSMTSLVIDLIGGAAIAKIMK